MKLSTRSPFDKKLKEFLPSWATKRLPSAVSTICSICFFTKRWVLGLVVTARKLRRLCFYRCLSFCPQGGGGMCGCSRGGVHGSSGGACMVALGGRVRLLQGVCMVALGGGMRGCSGGHAWLLREGGMHGCSRGACVVAPGGHAWLLQGGMHGCSRGRGMRGCSRGRGHAWLLQGQGHAWLLQGQGACVVAPGWGACMVALGGMHGCSRGHAWLFPGGMRGCSGGGMHGCSQGGCVVALGEGACVVFLMRYGQLAGSTHPTGMHSCFFSFHRQESNQLRNIYISLFFKDFKGYVSLNLSVCC